MSTAKPITVTVTTEVPLEIIHNAIVGAFEGGSTGWIHSVDLEKGQHHGTPNLVWWGKQSVFEQDFTMMIHCYQPTEDAQWVMSKAITNSDLVTGLMIMATKFSRHFSDLITENDDAETHDVFMQCVVYGDVVFG